MKIPMYMKTLSITLNVPTFGVGHYYETRMMKAQWIRTCSFHKEGIWFEFEHRLLNFLNFCAYVVTDWACK